MTLKNNDISFLLSDELQSFYWVGYILADGTIDKNRKFITITCGVLDKNHLLNFSNLSKKPINQYSGKSGYNENSTYCAVACYDSIIVPKLCNKFNLLPRKTYNPPNFNDYKFTDDQLIALFIGFIDGDGCISTYKNDNIRISIQNEKSWLNNLQFINNKLHQYFNVLQDNNVYVDKRGYATLHMGKSDIIIGLKQFILSNKLSAMARKWDKIPSLDIKQRERIKNYNSPLSKSVSINGTTFKSIIDAARYFNVSCQKITSNFEATDSKYNIKYSRDPRTIYQVCKDTGNTLRKFTSCREAAKFLSKTGAANIHKAAQQFPKLTAYGFRWRFEN